MKGKRFTNQTIHLSERASKARSTIIEGSVWQKEVTFPKCKVGRTIEQVTCYIDFIIARRNDKSRSGF